MACLDRLCHMSMLMRCLRGLFLLICFNFNELYFACSQIIYTRSYLYLTLLDKMPYYSALFSKRTRCCLCVLKDCCVKQFIFIFHLCLCPLYCWRYLFYNRFYVTFRLSTINRSLNSAAALMPQDKD